MIIFSKRWNRNWNNEIPEYDVYSILDNNNFLLFTSHVTEFLVLKTINTKSYISNWRHFKNFNCVTWLFILWYIIFTNNERSLNLPFCNGFDNCHFFISLFALFDNLLCPTRLPIPKRHHFVCIVEIFKFRFNDALWPQFSENWNLYGMFCSTKW